MLKFSRARKMLEQLTDSNAKQIRRSQMNLASEESVASDICWGVWDIRGSETLRATWRVDTDTHHIQYTQKKNRYLIRDEIHNAVLHKTLKKHNSENSRTRHRTPMQERRTKRRVLKTRNGGIRPALQECVCVESLCSLLHLFCWNCEQTV